ncbi:MAG: glycosyltransferase family 2 protein [Streptococcaceae bacterium]|jgi:glycosyltransferase involved in cell wall biosynthesis|nr:glycosyltransferase family 2 protein [Streptococcaceae bacterium]
MEINSYKEFLNSVSGVQKLLKDERIRNDIKLKRKNSDLRHCYEYYRKFKLSLVLLVKNQESLISEVIKQLEGFDIDNYIVVDTGSTDSTLRLLKSIPYVSLFQAEWKEDYSFMRNMAANYTDADWILTLDSDELFISSPFSLKVLIAILNEVMLNPFSISFEQHCPNCSEYGIPDRLYSPKTSLFFGLVHEEVRDKYSNLPTTSVLTRVKIENQGATPEQSNKFNKRKRYSSLIEKMIEIEPMNPRWIAFMNELNIRKLVQSGEYEKLLFTHIFVDGNFSTNIENIKRNKYTNILMEKYISILVRLKKYESVIKFSDLGLSVYPEDIPMMFFKMVAQIELEKRNIQRLYITKLNEYITINKESVYDIYFRDTQLLCVGLAELSYMMGKVEVAQSIISELSDYKALKIWEGWHTEEKI